MRIKWVSCMLTCQGEANAEAGTGRGGVGELRIEAERFPLGIERGWLILQPECYDWELPLEIGC